MKAYLFAIVCFLYVAGSQGFFGTALDDYVHQPDSVYEYHLLNGTVENGYTLYFLEMTSQAWQTPEFSSNHIWKHSMWICVPDQIDFETHGFLFINAGDNESDFTNGDDWEPYFLEVCTNINAISTILFQVPNQPIFFPDEYPLPQGTPLYEDAIIAHTFRSYMNDSAQNPSQILLFPMVKSGVRALDTIQDFVSKELHYNLQTFMVSGASKRGWTTWLLSAVDERVTATVPISIPLLNTAANILAEWPSLGEWGWALDDYTTQRIFDFAGLPVFDQLMDQVDPLKYNSRYGRLQKLIIDGTLDQFFLLDAPKYFYQQLAGPKWLRLVPNQDHSFNIFPGSHVPVVDSLTAFFFLTTKGAEIPTLTWTKRLSNSTHIVPYIEVTTTNARQIIEANEWNVTTTRAGYRDFRLNQCPPVAPPACFQYIINGNSFVNNTLEPFGEQWGGNVANYEANYTNLEITADKTHQHWTGFFAEFTFVLPLSNQHGAPTVEFTVTSESVVFPDFYPFPPHVPDYAAIGYCNYTVQFSQKPVHNYQEVWGTSEWSVTMTTTHDLYNAIIAVCGPVEGVTGLVHYQNNLYKVPSNYYHNGVLPAGSTINFSYTIRGNYPADIYLENNNACFPQA